MTTRQKIIAGVLVIVLLFILWQIVGLFGGGGGGTPPPITPVKPTQMTEASPTGPPAGTQPATPPGAGGPMPTTPGPMPTPTTNVPAPEVVEQPQPSQFSTGTVSLDNQIVKLQKETEQKFIDQLNQLQMLRVQRDIAETNQAIAAARLATVTAEKNVSDLLTKPAQPTIPISALQPPPPPVPEGAYAKALGGATAQIPGGGPGAPTVVAPETPAPPPPAPTTVVVIPEVKYVVISVSMQFGKWSAILGYEGKLFSVSVGDVLPPDNSVVASINKNGVVLVNKGKRRKLSMVTSV